MSKHVPVENRATYQEVFEIIGRAVCIIVGIIGTIFLIYWLLIAPYERHKEVIGKLDRIEANLSEVINHYYRESK